MSRYNLPVVSLIFVNLCISLLTQSGLGRSTEGAFPGNDMLPGSVISLDRASTGDQGYADEAQVVSELKMGR